MASYSLRPRRNPNPHTPSPNCSGMRTIQAMWPRLKVPLPTDATRRAEMLETVIRLHNLSAVYTPNHNRKFDAPHEQRPPPNPHPLYSAQTLTEVQTVYLEAFLRA